jgi:hypothetical protein
MNGELSAGWDALYKAVEQAMGTQLLTLLGMIGAGVFAFSVYKFLAARITNGSFAGTKALLIPLIFGAAVASARWFMGAILQGVESIVEVIIGIWNGALGG